MASGAAITVAFYIAAGLGGIFKNGSMFAIAMVGVIGIRKRKGGRTIKTA